MDKYQRPKNTNFLCAPRCNTECWRLMPSSTQITDKSLRKSQEKIVKGMTPLVLAMEELEKDEPSFDKVKTAVFDSFELMANMHMDINISRRESIRPHLHKAAHIANRDQPITENPFGDEVEAEMKKIEVASKLYQSMKFTDKTKKISNLKNRFKFF